MDLNEYFNDAKGHGVLATANSKGIVDAAIYAKPHIIDDDTIAFIMPKRLTHHNLQSNPHAAYLFLEEGEKAKGIRLFLTKIREEKDSELLYSLRRKKYGDDETPRYLVFFNVDRILPLIGAGEDKEKDGGKASID
ncbi:pyridoxamine 5'-phosphate oxidase family protein [bacterium]|nr:pyridoxamine 5'-phosphate oxidase family protein [bacterium]